MYVEETARVVIGDTLESKKSGDLYIVKYFDGQLFELCQPERDVVIEVTIDEAFNLLPQSESHQQSYFAPVDLLVMGPLRKGD